MTTGPSCRRQLGGDEPGRAPISGSAIHERARTADAVGQCRQLCDGLVGASASATVGRARVQELEIRRIDHPASSR
ncbi:hypothetical protein P4050_30520 [Pseudomonas aeruginosa]|nr:hypothetical protein [Pseudomonas aeruginosa]